jgi:hypothetical protein
MPDPAAPDPADLAVIIVNWNAAAYLPEALASLFAAQGGLNMQVWLIDNASTDGSPALVQAQFPQVRVVLNSTNVGFAAANNQGLRLARARYVLLLNPDTRLPAEALTQLLAFLEAHPEVGVVGPRLVGGRGKIQGGAAGYDPSPVTLFNYATFLYRLFPRRFRGLWLAEAHYRQDRPIAVDWVSGACMLVRREAIQAAGLLDERYFMYAEDVEWCRRIRAAGYRVVCYPAVSVVHYIGGSTRQRGHAFYAHHIDSLDRDLRRRYGRTQVALMHLFGAFGALLRFMVYDIQWRRWHNPVFAERRDLWAACLKTSLMRILIPAPAAHEATVPTPHLPVISR